MNVFLHYFSIKTKQDIPMIQTAINNFKSVGIIVASRPKMHAFTLGRDGGTVETGSPNKAILTAPNGCFSEKTNGSIQVTYEANYVDKLNYYGLNYIDAFFRGLKVLFIMESFIIRRHGHT